MPDATRLDGSCNGRASDILLELTDANPSSADDTSLKIRATINGRYLYEDEIKLIRPLERWHFAQNVAKEFHNDRDLARVSGTTRIVLEKLEREFADLIELATPATHTQPAGTTTGRTPPLQPIPLDAPHAPRLPDGIFTGWFGEMVGAVPLATETPRELSAAFGLGALATVCQSKFSVLIKPGYFEPVNLWPLCSMPSGHRKTASLQHMTKPLTEWEERQASEIIPQVERVTSERKTIESRIAKLRAEAAKAKTDEFTKLKEEIATLEAGLPEIPRVPQLFTQDVTPEHLGTMLADNGERLALISDEGGIFDMMGGRYSDGVPNLDVYLQAHAGSYVRVARGSRPPVNLKHPTLTIALSPQPDVLAGLTSSKGLRGRGLLARFIYMLPGSRLGYRTNQTVPVPDDVERDYRDGILRLADVTPDHTGDKTVPHVLSFTEEARDQWDGFWAEIEAMMREGGKLFHLTDWSGKLPGLVARVAGLLHCAEYASDMPNVKSIDASTVERAIEFGRYLIDHARIAFDLMGADAAMEAARDLWRQIEKSRNERFTARDAWHPLRGKYRRVEQADPGFDVLIDHGYIFEPQQASDEQPRRRGRPPSRQFQVNQSIAESWQ